MIPVCIFTFADDAVGAMIAAKRAASLGFTRIYLEVDAGKPFPPALAREAMALGYHYRLTRFPRVMNLLGTDCFRGMMDSYDFILRDSGAQMLLKLDSDTWIERTDSIFQAVRAGVLAAAHSSTRRQYHFYGCCCLLSKRLVDFIREDLKKVGRDGYRLPGGYQDFDMPEDLVTGTYADVSGLGEVRRWDYNPAGGFCAGWMYGEVTIPMDEYGRRMAARFEVIVFGNRSMLHGSECSKRDQVAATMMEFARAQGVVPEGGDSASGLPSLDSGV